MLAPAEKERVAKVLEEDAEVMTNTDARPLALQVALLIPLLAGLIGLFNSFRMMHLPEPKPSGSGETVLA